ncbi:hypothetical protein OEZ86_009540 [Tetradesmus obliquus]|nr:hypothetical protein OEZ86_009540 [Tetradesmus obliquus]
MKYSSASTRLALANNYSFARVRRDPQVYLQVRQRPKLPAARQVAREKGALEKLTTQIKGSWMLSTAPARL